MTRLEIIDNLENILFEYGDKSFEPLEDSEIQAINETIQILKEETNVKM